MADRQSTVRLGYAVDQNSVAAAVNANAQVAASFVSASVAAQQFSPEVLRLNPALAALAAQEQSAALATQTLANTQTLATNATAQNTTALAAQRTPLQDLTGLYKALEQQELKAAAAGAAVKAPSVGIGGVRDASFSSGFGTVRSLAGAAGLLAGNSQAGSALAAFSGLGSELGVVGVVAAGAALAVRAYTGSLEKSTERAKAFGDALQKAFLGTSEDIQGYIKDTEARIAADTALRDALKASATDAPAQVDLFFSDLTEGVNKLRGSLGLEEFPLLDKATISQEAYNAVVGEYDQKIQLAQIALDAYNQAFGTGIVATNNLIAAEEALAKRREEAASAIRTELDDEAAFRLHAADLRRSGTGEAVRDEIQANQDRVAIIDNFLIPSLTKAGISTLDLVLEANKLEAQNRLLQQSVLPLISAREREAAAIAVQLGVISDSIGYHQQLAEAVRNATVEQVADRLHALADERQALETYLPQLEALAPTSREAAQALEEAQIRLGQLSDDYADLMISVLPAAMLRAQQELAADQDAIRAKSQLKLNEIEAARTEAEGKASEARGDAYADSERKRGEALNDLAERQAAEREKIERKSGVAITNAVYGRNALAAFLAIQQKQQDLQDLTERGVEREKEIDKQARREREQAERNYDKALRNAQDAAEKSGRLERERAIRELNERINAYNQQIGLLDLFNVQGTQQITQFVNNAIAGLRNLANSVGAILSGASGGGIGAAVGGVIGMPPGWVPFPPASGWGIGGAVGGVLSAQRAPTYPIGATSGSRDLTGAPPRGLFPPQISPPTPIYRGAQASQQGAGAGSSYTFNISGSKQDARAIAKQIEPLIRSVTRDEVVEVANTLIGGRR